MRRQLLFKQRFKPKTSGKSKLSFSMRLLLAALSACLAADTNHTVYIIRHGEKTWSGGCLSPQGQERANVLPEIFDGETSKKHHFATPTKIFADQYREPPECERCWLTVEPIAQHLNLTVSFAHGHEFDGGNAAAAAAIKEAARAETVLVAWEHENIQYLAADLGVPTKSIPDWKSDDYDSVYELTFDAGGALAGFDALAQDYKPCSSDSKYKPCSKGAAVESRYA